MRLVHKKIANLRLYLIFGVTLPTIQIFPQNKKDTPVATYSKKGKIRNYNEINTYY